MAVILGTAHMMHAPFIVMSMRIYAINQIMATGQAHIQMQFFMRMKKNETKWKIQRFDRRYLKITKHRTYIYFHLSLIFNIPEHIPFVFNFICVKIIKIKLQQWFIARTSLAQPRRGDGKFWIHFNFDDDAFSLHPV